VASECLAPCPQGRGFKAWIALQRFSLCAFSHSERFGAAAGQRRHPGLCVPFPFAAPSCSERRHRGLEQRENANDTLTTVTLHLRSEGVTGKRRFPGRGPDDRRGLEPPLRTSHPRRLRTNRGGHSKPEIPVETRRNQRWSADSGELSLSEIGGRSRTDTPVMGLAASRSSSERGDD